MNDQPIDFDSPWKEAIERYFPEFMAFCFPGAHAGINWARGYTFLDKELQQVVREADTGRRHVDKLVQVWRLDGEEAWVLVHIEVQGQEDPDFALRMYLYHYRLFDRYGRQVVSLAVLSDEKANWRPDAYSYELWGCRMQLQFPTVKLLDFAAEWEALEQNPNPFAIVVMAHLKTQATRRNTDARLDWKLRIVRELYRRGYSRVDILDLFRFIDWLMVLPDGVEQLFWTELERLEENQTMPYITSVERMALARGRKEGREEGREEGALQAAREAIFDVLDIRFGAAPLSLREVVADIDDLFTLKELHKQAVIAGSLDAFGAVLTTAPKSDALEPPNSAESSSQ